MKESIGYPFWCNVHDKRALQTSERRTFTRDAPPSYLTLNFSTTKHVFVLVRS
jgi:hypothetical protein